MIREIDLHLIQPIRSFNRSARLYLVMLVVYGIIYSAWQLFFNFYILESGHTREFLGIVNSMPSAAALIFGIPLGRLSDRIGRRISIIVGIGLSCLFMLAQVTVRAPYLIVISAFLFGLAGALFIVSQAPLMAKVSDSHNRTMLFSLSFGVETLAGAVGAAFAGQLPAVFGRLLSVGEHSAVAYQAVLMASILLSASAVVPIWMMKEPGARTAEPTRHADPQRPAGPGAKAGGIPASLLKATLRMTAPQLLIGFGAAILIPYINVFFKDQFRIQDSLLGVLFSLSSLMIGIGSIAAPRLAVGLSSKIRAVVFTQSASLVFLLLIGFSPFLWLSSLAYLLRTSLMNMSAPLYSAFCMENTPEQHQGFVNSVLNLSWNVGWAVGPFISGVVQTRQGFGPLFVATAVLYGAASVLIWIFFKDSEGPAVAASSAVGISEHAE
jgi:MFS family permease